MVENEPGHLKHTDTVPALQDLFEFVIGFNESFVLGVLEVMATDIIP